MERTGLSRNQLTRIASGATKPQRRFAFYLRKDTFRSRLRYIRRSHRWSYLFPSERDGLTVCSRTHARARARALACIRSHMVSPAFTWSRRRVSFCSSLCMVFLTFPRRSPWFPDLVQGWISQLTFNFSVCVIDDSWTNTRCAAAFYCDNSSFRKIFT
jgi:hypothetical protein